MLNNAHDAYLESRVLSADPLELVTLLYQACTRAVRDALRHCAAGDIAARSWSITRAMEILIELDSSLDRERGGEISIRLERLYEYMRYRLLEANAQQAEAPMAEVLGLLATLSEAWESLSRKAEAKGQTAVSPWAQPLPEPELACSGQHWSF